MTGSLSNISKISHGNTAAWVRLQSAPADVATEMRAQPATWWSAQADQISKTWLETGLPSTRLEDWKYTSLASFHSKARTAGLGGIAVAAPNGVQVLRLSEVDRGAKLSDADRTTIREMLSSRENVFFENMAKSLVADPVVIVVPAKYASEQAIEINWRGLPDGQWGFGVAAVLIGEGASVSLVEKYGAGSDAQTHSTILRICRGAKLSHLRLQTGESRVGSGFVMSSTHARVMADANYQNAQVSFGSQLSREDLVVELCEAGAETVTDGVFIGRSAQLLDHHTNLIHRVGNTTSRQIYKGVLADEARGVFNGRIAISKNASGSHSSQMNKNLLLSRKVELDTKPQLEIDNDDVKAAHGAAIGRLDPEHIFYLRSRGIEMSQAVEILARGFANEAVQRLDSSALRSAGIAAIERGLSGLSWEAL